MSYTDEPFSSFLVRAMSEAKLTNQQLAAQFGISSQAVSQWRSGKNRPKSSVIDSVRKYLSDAAPAPSASHMATPKQSQLDGTYGLVRIPEYDVQAAAGAGLEVPDLQDTSKIWTLPRSALAGVRATSLNNLAIVTVAGESMIPDYLPGEKVLVDVGDRTVSHDGAYIIHNRYGLVVKMVQIIPGSSPEQDVLRIISKNPDYSPYDQPVADVMIQGRVVGKWVWK
ncbi:XRE family transcriptional regulator [Bombella mellum]|uniref:HTH cro/C1-type domain-containing protein n=1 Tax=Bombella mellum TaxID=2039288 RepID=A0ABR5ZRI3_9PROT|nr:LexA family transcriptional regulator [Bombella mellum]MBA5726935.1 hypothetical protein [Bombella mellum]